MAPILSARDLHKQFGAVVAASDINVEIAEHELVGIIGANGAGKTTFINMVTGHLKPDKGTILFRGQDITGFHSRQVTRLGNCRSFQIPQIFAPLTVLDNMLVALGAAYGSAKAAWQPFRRAERVEAAERILANYGLLPEAHRPAGLLAQGTRKLLDIAMATVNEPPMVLLDEPTSGISVDEKFAMMDRLMEALRRVETTVLFVEHDMEIVERYANRVIAFYDGRVIADGPPERVLADADVRRHVVGAELHRRPAAANG